MKKTKYFIEGQAAARGAYTRVCRYNKEDNVREWQEGFDSIPRDYVVFRICKINKVSPVTTEDLSPVYVGTLQECEDKLSTLYIHDRGATFIIYNSETGKPYTSPYEII